MPTPFTDAPDATLRAQIVPGRPDHATDPSDEHGDALILSPFFHR